MSVTALAATPATPAPPPTLSHNDQLAAKLLAGDINTVMKEVAEFQQEVSKHNPGYHYNFTTGQLEKDAVPSAPVSTPAPAKEAKPAPAPAAKDSK